jgi:hypothetical protein
MNDINVLTTMKFLEELDNIEFGNDFLDKTRAQATKEKIDKKGLHENGANMYIKRQYQQKRHCTEWRKYLKVIYLIRQ